MDTRTLYLGVAAIAVALIASPASLRAQQAASAQVSIGPDNIGGVVMGPNGPEAGVWVIAETTDLPTRLIKSVVTDDQGRYLIPELPKASYEVFARGLRVEGFAAAEERARQDRQHHDDCGDAEGSGRALSGDLLVFDAEDAGEA